MSIYHQHHEFLIMNTVYVIPIFSGANNHNCLHSKLINYVQIPHVPNHFI
uniref:Uncharacterized protein n=1 Tax=Arundo donax TaxID=35708 RepID=A0A0A9F5T0_ARUDO